MLTKVPPMPVAEMVPQGGEEHVRLQITPLSLGSLLTVAVNACVPFGPTVAVVGATETEIPAGGLSVMVMVAEPDFVVSATEVAVSVTVAGLGTLAGAL